MATTPMRSPLLLVAAGFALGILLAGARHVTGLTAATLPAGSAVCLLAGVLALRRGWVRVSLLLALLGFLAAGTSAACLFEYRFAPNHVSRLAALGVDVRRPIRLEGRIVSSPDPHGVWAPIRHGNGARC